MSDSDNNMFNDLEEEPTPEEPKAPSNRNFIIVVGVIAAIMVVAIIAMIFLVVFYLPRVNANRLQQAALINAQNTATALAATQQSFAQSLALTPSATLVPTATQKPSPTPVVVFPTETPEPTVTETPLEAVGGGGPLDPRTQTVAALLTQAAGGGVVSTTTTGGVTPTTLPTTGFAEDVGLPGMLGLSILFVAVIVLVRRLRLSGDQG
jgi:type II secretory pathway pseudopilin PulG